MVSGRERNGMSSEQLEDELEDFEEDCRRERKETSLSATQYEVCERTRRLVRTRRPGKGEGRKEKLSSTISSELNSAPSQDLFELLPLRTQLRTFLVYL